VQILACEEEHVTWHKMPSLVNNLILRQNLNYRQFYKNNRDQVLGWAGCLAVDPTIQEIVSGLGHRETCDAHT
jgi:hypothetical protein